MTSAREARRLLDQVIAERGQLVPQVARIRRLAGAFHNRRRRRRVDVHEQRLDARAGEARAQGPVAVRTVVHRDARERVPLAEQHTVALMTLGVDDGERAHRR